jgi:hypothetical protein
MLAKTPSSPRGTIQSDVMHPGIVGPKDVPYAITTLRAWLFRYPQDGFCQDRTGIAKTGPLLLRSRDFAEVAALSRDHAAPGIAVD